MPKRAFNNPLSGILLVDKPAEWTSFDVVNCVRSRFQLAKVGHCGTLDPAATGLLVLVLGKCTALSTELSGKSKSYRAVMKLGVETASGDLDGEVVRECDASGVSEMAFRAAITSFVGDILQKPPMVSALKVGGKRLYELARQGIEVEREARPVTISDIRILRCAGSEAEFEVDCSKGTYIRTLVTDIGAKLGVGAVLCALRRTRSGDFALENAHSMAEIKTWEVADLEKYILPPPAAGEI